MVARAARAMSRSKMRTTMVFLGFLRILRVLFFAVLEVPLATALVPFLRELADFRAALPAWAAPFPIILFRKDRESRTGFVIRSPAPGGRCGSWSSGSDVS